MIHQSPLTFEIQTENAAARIKELLKGEGAKDAIGIRLGVKRRKYIYLPHNAISNMKIKI